MPPVPNNPVPLPEAGAEMKLHCDSAKQHVPESGNEPECKRSDCPGERGWEMGYGLAGGGCDPDFVSAALPGEGEAK